MSLCPHGYTAFYDCPNCEEPMGTKPAGLNSDTGPQWVELRELAPGARFMFAAADLPNRGPCTLIEKGAGVAIIEYAPHDVVKTFKSRYRHGQIVEKTITQTLSGRSHCALGAQVVELPNPPEVSHA
jgi:hypothetical protein